ncbi:MAG: four helix bundle protein [Chloroflexi bacterium]|nr:four helix bundle protein [Chloroflexota bacterium]
MWIPLFEIALKSANETTYWLGLLEDALAIQGSKMTYLLSETDEISRIIAASLLTMKNKR